MHTPHHRYTRALALGLLLSGACSTDQTNPTQDNESDKAENAAVANAAREANVQLSSLHGRHIQLYQSSCTTSFVITEFVPAIGPDGKPVIGPDGRPIPASLPSA